MLTPKMSLRRNNIMKNYLPVIQEMYANQDVEVKGEVKVLIYIHTYKYTYLCIYVCFMSNFVYECIYIYLLFKKCMLKRM
jgi:hypothetical protein